MKISYKPLEVLGKDKGVTRIAALYAFVQSKKLSSVCACGGVEETKNCQKQGNAISVTVAYHSFGG